MGVLKCRLFTTPPNLKLELCANEDRGHVTPGATGAHVKLIQIALNNLAGVFLAIDGIYGPKTAAAVVKFKEAQKPPLRQTWQGLADNIVGIRTIKALDEQMKKLDDQPIKKPGYICFDPFGDPHDHSKCVPFLDSDDWEGKISHHGTPLNPKRGGKMITMGGTNEVKYLGFENYVPNPALDPQMREYWVRGRPFTSSLQPRSVSDISYRSAPITTYMEKEMKRIAMPGCRLTFANNSGNFVDIYPYITSLGPVLQTGMATKPNDSVFDPNGLHVIVVTMVNLD